MSTFQEKNHIGIDVSKALLDIMILPSKQHFQIKNTKEGIKGLLKTLQVLGDTLIVMEATGGYEKRLANTLSKANQDVAVINPRQIRDFAKP